MDACMCAMKKVYEKNIPRFFVVILTHLFYVLGWKNIQLIVVSNDEYLFDKRIIAFITFVTIRNYYFFFEMPGVSLCFFFFILTFFQTNIWVASLIFCFTC